MAKSVEEVRQSARAFALREIAPIAAQIDRDDEIPRDVWRKLGSAQWMGMTIPTPFGGEGLSYFHHLVAIEEMSRVSGTVGFAYAAHANICVDNLFKHANERQREKYLPKLLTGEFVGEKKNSVRKVAATRPPMTANAIGPQKIERDSGIIARPAAAAVRVMGRMRRTVDSTMASHSDSPRATSCWI